ncbi:MAG: flavodoxin domain-containing protein [Geovibrio sp.]|nr:flavodoxin domain-containing protein [Geovibrio sp.]
MGDGDLQDDWEALKKPLANADLSGKTVALFGSGDQDGYPDTFVDGIGILYDAGLLRQGDVVGFVSTDGYSYDASLAERDGEFVGLPIDEDNQADMTDERIKAWVASICESFAG